MKVSVYQNSQDKIGQPADLSAVVAGIQTSDRLRQHTEAAQAYLAAGDKHLYDFLKSGRKELLKPGDKRPAVRLTGFTPSGVFKVRKDDSLTFPSGLVVIDLDHLADPVAVKEQVAQEPTCAMVYLSPSGHGVKALFQVEPIFTDAREFGQAWSQVSAYVAAQTGQEVDPSGKNVGRLAFLSYDPQVYYNPDPTPFPVTYGKVSKGFEAQMGKGGQRPYSVDAIIKAVAAFLNREKYNDRLSLLCCVKAKGYSIDEAKAIWAVRVTGSEGEPIEPETNDAYINQKWETLAEDDSGLLDALMPHNNVRPQTETDIEEKWALVGSLFAERYLEDWIYSNSLGWFHWTGQYWEGLTKADAELRFVDILSRHILSLISETATKHFSQELGLKMAKDYRPTGAFLAGLFSGTRISCEAVLPQPNKEFFPAANGLVNLKTGELIPHAKEYGMRGIAKGNYGEPHPEILDARLDLALDADNKVEFLKWLGLVATRRVQHYPGSVTLLIGDPGSGKGGIQQLLRHALGKLYYTGKSDLFRADRPSGHDQDRADLVLRDPLIVGLDEKATGNVRMVVENINHFTGNNEVGPFTRKGDRTPIVGNPTFAILYTAVDAPTLGRGTGLDRRLAILSTREAIPDEVKQTGDLPQELADALVTAMCREAAVVETAGWHPTTGTATNWHEIAPDIDPILTQLEELLHEPGWDGNNLSNLTESLADKLPYGVHPPNGKTISHKIKVLGWQVSSRERRNGKLASWLTAPTGWEVNETAATRFVSGLAA